jgi:hypothetical protein
MCDCRSTEQFWQQVDEAHARALVSSAIDAARAQVEYSRAFTTAQRMTVLLGPNASREYEVRAEMHHQTRSMQLQNTKQAFVQFAAGLDEAGKQRITDFLKAGRVKDFTVQARQSTVLTLLHADLTPNEAQNAVNALDGTLGKVAGLTSWQEMADYFNQHLDELQAQKVGEATSEKRALCILILLLTFIYVIMVLIAIFACAGSSDPACANKILNEELDQACGS